MSSDVVSTSIDVLQLLCKSLGPVVVERHMEQLTSVILRLLDGEGKCQIPIDEEGEDEQVIYIIINKSLINKRNIINE
jgi:hypothetical protein